MQLWSRLIEKCGLYCANKVKNSNFQYFRGNNSGVTGRILLIIKLIRDLVARNTSCKFGPDWLRNEVSIALTRKELTDARTTEELPWHKPLRPLASGAKNQFEMTDSSYWKPQRLSGFLEGHKAFLNGFLPFFGHMWENWSLIEKALWGLHSAGKCSSLVTTMIGVHFSTSVCDVIYPRSVVFSQFLVSSTK